MALFTTSATIQNKKKKIKRKKRKKTSKHTNVNNKAGTVMYIFYNTVQSRQDSSHATRASDVCIVAVRSYTYGETVFCH